MENASKALIIAGAILLAILLISLGIMIFGQAQDTVNNSGMSQADIQAFNNKILKYEGEHKSGSEVKALINEVKVSNADDNNSNRIIALRFKGKSARDNKDYEDAVLTTTAAISTSSSYTVKLTYATADDTSKKQSKGCVCLINISQE